MKAFILALWFAALTLFAAQAGAVLAPVATWNYSGGPGGFTSADAACAAYAGTLTGWTFNATEDFGTPDRFGCRGAFNASGNDRYGFVTATGQTACPANSTGTTSCTCNSGFTESGGQCVAVTNVCTPNKGKTSIVNWTVGFTRSADSADTNTIGAPNTFPPTNEVCSGGCIMVGDPYGAGSQAWKSQAPTAQGLYRLSMDVPMTNSGDACTGAAKDAPAVPTTADVQCPGYVGEVNGKVGCYGTAERPVATSSNGTPPPGAPAAGNPAAGPKPPTGEGSGTGSAGRTPSSGNGGNSGGPAAAAAGGTGTRGGGAQTVGGTGRVGTTTGEEQAPCGAPGQPICNVKVDETGTPASSNFTGATTAMDAAEQSAKDGFAGAHNIAAPTWSFSFQLPTGCSPYQVASFKGLSFKMDPCQYQPIIHDLMSMLWAAVTAFCMIGMVGRTIRES